MSTFPSCTCGPPGSDECSTHLPSDQRAQSWTKLPHTGKGTQVHLLHELLQKLEEDFSAGRATTFKNLYGADSPLNKLYTKYFSKPKLEQQTAVPIYKAVIQKIANDPRIHYRFTGSENWKDIESEVNRYYTTRNREPEGLEHPSQDAEKIESARVNQVDAPRPIIDSFSSAKKAIVEIVDAIYSAEVSSLYIL
jgi:hypothetical protein